MTIASTLQSVISTACPELNGLVLHGQQLRADTPRPTADYAAFWISEAAPVGHPGDYQSDDEDAPGHFTRIVRQQWHGQIVVVFFGDSAETLAYEFHLRLQDQAADAALTEAGIGINPMPIQVQDQTAILDAVTWQSAYQVTLAAAWETRIEISEHVITETEITQSVDGLEGDPYVV